MFRDYLIWWTEQMVAWVPARFVNRDLRASRELIITLREDANGQTNNEQPSNVQKSSNQFADVTLRRQRRDRKLGRFELSTDGLQALRAVIPTRPPVVVLKLSPDLLLEREVVLPLAAEREPERVLTYEMDRVTPFVSTDVFWTYAIMQRDRVRGRLHIRLSMVTKAVVQTPLAALVQAGLGPKRLEVENTTGFARHIALHRPDPRRERFGRRVLAGVASVCAALAVAVVAFPFLLQSAATTRLESRLATLRPQVAEAEALRRQMAVSAAGNDAAAAERARVGDALTVLSVLTASLPDDTYLEDLTLRQGKLTINGRSATAARLIAALSSDPTIRNPEFVAPVTRIDNHDDLFAIRAEVGR